MSGGGGGGGTATTSYRTILEKPLNQLTEDDISQLTREDCRKYLKEKGMRRPSWNKSQAIQQVISLKALLEPNEDSGAGVLRRIVSGPHNNNNGSNIARPASNSADSAKEASTEVQKSASVEEPPPQRPKLVHEDRPASAAAKAVSPSRNQCTADPSARQMTIFYCGRVNVYDGVPPDKAQSIMHLAATPNHVPLDNQIGGTAAARSFRSQYQNAGDKDGPLPPCATISQAMQTEKIVDYSQLYWEKGNSTRDPEGEANRQVSLQRYREKKRKDRERVKNKKNMGSTSSLEVYLNHQLRRHTSNGNSSRSSTSSPPQHPGLLQAVDNHPKFRCLAVDLNENDILENHT